MEGRGREGEKDRGHRGGREGGEREEGRSYIMGKQPEVNETREGGISITCVSRIGTSVCSYVTHISTS